MSATTEQSGATAIRPFKVDVPEGALEDLRRRVSAVRWPSRELVTDRSQGVQLATIQELARYWTTDYDWRRCEARLNALPQFKTEIEGEDVHFIHVKSRARGRAAADPHPRLARLDHRDARGDRPADRPDRARRSARRTRSTWWCRPSRGTASPPSRPSSAGRRAASREAWGKLMPRLGYTRYVAQGGDVGAAVTDAMGRQAPEGLLGIHMNLFVPALVNPSAFPVESEEERAAADAITDVPDERQRLPHRAEHAAADDRVRPARFACRPGGLDA